MAPTVSTCGRLAGYSSGLPAVRLLPAAATTTEPEPIAYAIIASNNWTLVCEPRLRLITLGPFRIAASSPLMTSPALIPSPNGLASQTRSAARG